MGAHVWSRRSGGRRPNPLGSHELLCHRQCRAHHDAQRIGHDHQAMCECHQQTVSLCNRMERSTLFGLHSSASCMRSSSAACMRLTRSGTVDDRGQASMCLDSGLDDGPASDAKGTRRPPFQRRQGHNGNVGESAHCKETADVVHQTSKLSGHL